MSGLRNDMLKHKPITMCRVNTITKHYSDVTWISWRLKSPATPLHAQRSVQMYLKNTRYLLHWPLCGESTGDRWIPLTQRASDADDVSISGHHYEWCLPAAPMYLICSIRLNILHKLRAMELSLLRNCMINRSFVAIGLILFLPQGIYDEKMCWDYL